MNISVVIPTYNRRECLQQCLETLSKQDFPLDKFEIVVVDDCSGDDTASMLLDRAKRPLRVVTVLQKRNQGQPAAAADAFGVESGKPWP